MAVNLTLMNLPEALYERIKRLTAAYQRSPDSKGIVWLESAASPDKRSAADILARVDAARVRLKSGRLTDEDINRFKNEGRP